MTMLAFRVPGGESKSSTLARMQAHLDADRIIQGMYQDDRGRGCAVGCMTGGRGHSEYPVRWGIPVELAHIEDHIHERLSAEESRVWPIQFLDAIPDGADLSMVTPRFLLAVLSDPESPIQHGLGRDDQVDAAVRDVADLYREWVQTGVKPDKGRFDAAAYAAAAATGVDLAAAAAVYAAYAAVYAAYAAAAANDHAANATTLAACADAFRWMRDTLLRLLREAPVPETTP